MVTIDQISILYPEKTGMESLANTLANKIRRYKIPRGVVKRTGISSLADVKEPWLIVLCVPETPGDQKIEQILREYTERGLYRHILTLLVSGLPEDSFPEILLHETLPDGTVVDHEPLAANISAETQKAARKKLNVEKLRLLAPILGVSFDDLMNRRRRQRMRIFTILGAVVLAAGIGFLILMIQRIRVFSEQTDRLNAQYERIDTARQQAQGYADDMNRSYAAAIGAGAREMLDSGDCELAMLLCLQFLPEMADMQELTSVLQDALTIRGGAGYVPVTAAEMPADLQPAELPEDLPSEYGMTWCHVRSSEGFLLYQLGEEKACVYDPQTQQTVGSCISYTYPSDAASICFAGKQDPDSGLYGAERILCDGILFEYRDQQTPVPQDLEEQVTLAESYLNGRTLTEEERAFYGIT